MLMRRFIQPQQRAPNASKVNAEKEKSAEDRKAQRRAVENWTNSGPDRLDDLDRIVNLYESTELTIPEIARVVGCSVSKVNKYTAGKTPQSISYASGKPILKILRSRSAGRPKKKRGRPRKKLV